MTGTVLIGVFMLLLLAGVPLAVGLGVASVVVLAMAGFDQLAVPTNIYAGIAKYPLLAIPMFVLAGMIFERSGVAVRLVRFVTAIVGEWTGSARSRWSRCWCRCCWAACRAPARPTRRRWRR